MTKMFKQIVCLSIVLSSANVRTADLGVKPLAELRTYVSMF